MKIAFFVSGFPLRSETFILQQIAGLLDRGHDVHIYASDVRGREDLHADYRSYGMLQRTRRYRSVSARSLPARVFQRAQLLTEHFSRHPGVVLRALNVFKFGKRAVSLDVLDMALSLRDRPEYDIVHCHFGPNGNDAATLIDLGVLRGQLIVTFHSYDILLGIKTRGKVYRALLQRAAAVHSISEYNRKWLESFGFHHERIHYHPMGIDVGRFAPVEREEAQGRKSQLQILTVARLAPEKGLEYALAALAGVRSQRPDVQLRYRVIGGGPLAASLGAKAHELGLQDIVEFTGPKDQEFVRRALGEADLLLLPSLAEALPIAIMEAMAFGLPVIATDVGGVGELVRNGQTGRLVPPADAVSLEAALLELLQASSAERRRLGRRGRALVTERHDTTRLADRLVEHYQGLIQRRSSAGVHDHSHRLSGVG